MRPSARCGIRLRSNSVTPRASAKPSRCASAARPHQPRACRSTATPPFWAWSRMENKASGAKVKFGAGAGIRIGGIEVALIAHRTQALGTEIFSAVGIDLSTKRYVGVKSTNHFYAAYAPIAAKVLYCDGEGPSPLDA